jgi:preprotein translocase subunit SecG
MENLVLIVHVVIAVAIIGLILLQQGKGAEMGASFGAGASQTIFGSAGSGNFFSRLTALLAAVFFVTSFSLAVISKNNTVVNQDIPVPSLRETRGPAQPEADEIPTVEQEAPGTDVPAAPEAE